MDHLGVFFLSFFFLYFHVEAQETLPPTKHVYAPTSTVHKSVVILIVILSFLFFVTFILIIYPRLCFVSRENNRRSDLISTISSTRFSGIDKSLIDSLPSFTFSSLQGSKEGLECAVCLSKFKDTEVLRLLPKCKHTFHGSCVDKWLANNSNCPLCRQKVDIEDIGMFKSSSSFSIPHSHSEAGIGMHMCTSDPPQSPQWQEPREPDLPYSHSNADVELFVQREESKDKEDKSAENEMNKASMHKFKHKIRVFGVIFNRRWSDVDLSDIISLNSDMINSTSSRMLSSYDSHSERYMSTMLDNTTFPTEDKRMKFEEIVGRRLSSLSDIRTSTSDIKPKSDESLSHVITLQGRSVSEITTITRFSELTVGNNVEEERMRAWLAIAKQTVQSFGGKERSKQSQCSGKQSVV